MNILPGGSAQQNGELKANDRILAVGEGKSGKLVDVVGWRLDDVVQIIRGQSARPCACRSSRAMHRPARRSTCSRCPATRSRSRRRRRKKEVRKIKRGDQELKVGVINVPSFYQDYDAHAAGDEDYRSTTRDVRKLIDELKAEGGVDGMVIDLRGNGGGHLTEAIGLSSLFVPNGPVVQLRETGGRVEVLESERQGVAYDGPLTSSSIASARRRRRSSPPRCRTTAAASWSASRPTARARCRTSTRSIATRSARIRASAS